MGTDSPKLDCWRLGENPQVIFFSDLYQSRFGESFPKAAFWRSWWASYSRSTLSNYNICSQNLIGHRISISLSTTNWSHSAQRLRVETTLSRALARSAETSGLLSEFTRYYLNDANERSTATLSSFSPTLLHAAAFSTPRFGLLQCRVSILWAALVRIGLSKTRENSRLGVNVESRGVLSRSWSTPP